MTFNPGTKIAMRNLAKRAHIGIRRAEATDTDNLSNLTSELALDWPAMFAASGVYSYLAEGDEPFGVVSVAPASQAQVDGAGEVVAWYLHPEFRGAGLGKKLLVHGLSVLKRRDFDVALIWVPETADEALEVLDGLRFVPDEVKPIGDVNLLLFTRNLDDYF